jgi:hypothetical protein
MWLGAVRCATDRPVRVRLGRVWSGPVTADDLSAEPFGALRWVLWNPDLLWRFQSRCGAARSGLLRAADGSTEGHPSLLLSLRVVMAGYVMAWRSEFGPGSA